MPVEVACEECGSVSEKPPSEADGSNFCGRDCYESHVANTVTLSCDNCGDDFERNESQAERRERSFCSKGCYTEWQETEGPRGEDHWSFESIEIVCDNCGETYFEEPSHAEKYERSFCSKECEQEWKSEHLFGAGEDAPNWRGGHEKHYGETWEEQREKAIKRAGGSCESCGTDEGELRRSPDVHHIKPLRLFDNPDDAHSLDNLIALCPRCHNRFDSRVVLSALLSDGVAGAV